jgi:hypothetical protein
MDEAAIVRACERVLGSRVPHRKMTLATTGI